MSTTVKLSEYAAAYGIPGHGPAGIAYVRISPEEKAGPAKGPPGLRVSRIRQGVTAMKVRGLVIESIVDTPRLTL